MSESDLPLPPLSPEPISPIAARPIKKRFLVVPIFSLGLVLLLTGALYVMMKGPLATTTTVVITKGSKTAAIAEQFVAADILHEPYLLRILTRLAGKRLSIKAGEYIIPAGISFLDLIKLLHEGKTVQRQLTVSEGKTSAEIIMLLNNDPVLSGTVTDIPPEGTLLPETYNYSYGDDRNDLIKRMQQQMQKTVNELWPSRAPDLVTKTLTETLTLASIIEKETGMAAERGRVAGVFMNRLRKGMKLQSDPTVIYALTNGQGPLSRALTRKDWELISPYNTYYVTGLPPQPIANPGRASIEAALHPEKNDYLYFVADGTGGHAFAKTLVDHNKNVAAWQKIQKKN